MATHTRSSESPQITARSARAATALVILVVIAALNLRPTVTTLGPLLPDVRASLHLNGFLAGLLTSLPPLCFALFGPLAPRLARRFGLLGVLAGGLGAVTVGLAARAVAPDDLVFLLFSAVALAGIAVSNVLMPAIISRYFPDRIGSMTGLYAAVMSGGSAVAAAVAVPVTNLLGGSWRSGLGVWALLGAAGLALALPRRDGRPAATAGPAGTSLWRSPTAVALALFFATCSTSAYTVMGWMPQIYRDAGLSPTSAGLMLALAMILGVPLSFLIPALAARRPDQRGLVVALVSCGAAAYAGLAFAPATLPWLWATLSGIGLSVFSLALTMLGLRSRTHQGVARLSSFAQSTGYLISIPGPILIGVLYQHTRSWSIPIALLAALLVPQLLTGLLAARPRLVEDELAS